MRGRDPPIPAATSLRPRWQIWRAYKAAPGTDWWTAFYPNDNAQRPTGPRCDGCHSVNYNI